MALENINQIVVRSFAVVEISINRFLRDRKTILLGIIGVLPTLLALILSQAGDLDEFRANYVTLVDTIFLFVVVLFCLIFAISNFKDEQESNTLSYLLSRPLTRFEIYIMKFLAFELVTIPLMIVCMFPSYLVMALGQSSEAILSEFSLFYGSCVLIIVAITFYGAIFMLLSILLSKPLIPSFVIGLMERLLSLVFGGIDVGAFVPGYHLGAIGNALIPYGVYATEKAIAGWQGLLVLIVVSAAAIFAGLIAMKTKDFP